MPKGVYARSPRMPVAPLDPAKALAEVRARAVSEFEQGKGRAQSPPGRGATAGPPTQGVNKNVRRRFDPLRVFEEQRAMARRQKELKALALNPKPVETPDEG